MKFDEISIILICIGPPKFHMFIEKLKGLKSDILSRNESSHKRMTNGRDM